MKNETYYIEKLKENIFSIKNVIRFYEEYIIAIKSTDCDYMRKHCMKCLHITYCKINQYELALQKIQGSRYVNWRHTDLNTLEKYTLDKK